MKNLDPNLPSRASNPRHQVHHASRTQDDQSMHPNDLFPRKPSVLALFPCSAHTNTKYHRKTKKISKPKGRAMYDYKLEEEMDTPHDAYKSVQVSNTHLPPQIFNYILFTIPPPWVFKSRIKELVNIGAHTAGERVKKPGVLQLANVVMKVLLNFCGQAYSDYIWFR